MTKNLTIEWDKCSEREWNRLLESAATHAFQQSWGYGEALREFGAPVTRAVVKVDGTIVALAQIHSKTYVKFITLKMAMFGPVWLGQVDDATKAATYKQLKQELKGRYPTFRVFMPNSDDAAVFKQLGMKQVVSGYSTAMIDLRQSEDTLIKNMNRMWRNYAKAETAGELEFKVHVVGQKPSQYAWILEKELEATGKKGYDTVNPLLVPKYQNHAGKETVMAFRAEADRENVAAVLMLVHGNTATYHMGWANEKAKELGAPTVLLWSAMRKLKAKGIEWFDLGGLNTKDLAGIARFKLNSGGELVTLPGSYL